MNFNELNKVVVKVGTNALMREAELNKELMTDLVAGICALREKGKRIVVVSSGAVGLGKRKLGLNASSLPLDLQQATAAIGQPSLMSEYEKRFELYGVQVAQLLLTEENLKTEASFNNVKNMLNRLLELGVVPIINENDSVSVAELEDRGVFSDNDNLASLVTEKLGFDLMVLLTNVEGLYDSNPANGNATLIAEVNNTAELCCDTEGCSPCGRGGMNTKIEAAARVTKAGGNVLITKLRKSILHDLAQGVVNGTVFNPKA